MASLVRFTPIVGSYQTEAGPACYLLEIDSHKLLLDCGLLPADTNGRFRADEAYLRALKRVAKGVDAVLLSHGDLKHCGALPLIVECLGPAVPIYATVPVHHMGLMTLYDTLQSLEPFGSLPFGYDQVDAAFDRIQRLRYSQPVSLASSITLTALPAGHSVGGSMWRIRKAPAEDILYTAAFNHKREAHLEGAVFDAITRPSVMIVDAQQALAPAVIRKDRDASFFSAIQGALRAGGSVLIPCDSGVRLLELAFILDSSWAELMGGNKAAARAYILTHQSYRTVEFAKGMLEWMSQSVMKVFDTDRSNPFAFKHLKLIHSPDEIVPSTSTPSIILASSESLDYGHSHALLQFIGRSSANCILAPFEPLPGSVLNKILTDTRLAELTIKTWKKVPLEGDELTAHLSAKREEEEKRAADAAFAAYERARREGGVELLGDAVEDALEDGTGRDELLERQIEDAEAFRAVFWVDYRNDWNMQADDPMHMLLQTPELFSDIYLQLGAAGGKGKRFQCFPSRDVVRTVNEYGEVVQGHEFEIAGVKTDLAMKGDVKGDVNTNQTTSTTPTATPEIPFKWISQDVKVSLKCSRRAVNGFAGLSDGRSLKTIISRINPRKLVLIGGSVEATEFLLNHYRESGDAIEVHAPRVSETVNVSSAMNLLSAVISEALLNQLRVTSCQDYEVSHLQGRLRMVELAGDDKEASGVTGSDGDVQMTEGAPKKSSLEIVPVPVSALPACPSVIVGDLRLSELRRFISMKYSSMSTEFTSNGDLICNGRVLVRRDQGTGQIWVEGPLCKEYYQVRASLYENVTMV